MMKWLACAALLVAPAVAGEVSAPFERLESGIEAPTGDNDLSFVTNYVRIAPNVGIGGVLTSEGPELAKAAGFKTIIDIRGADEDGVAAEEAAAADAGITYHRLSMPRDAAEIEAYLPQLAAMLDDRANYPVLLHCVSGNRAGAAWALYRAESGVPALIAIEEGRAAGMRSREGVVREILGVQ